MKKVTAINQAKFGPSNFAAEVGRLQREGKMPSLAEVLAAVGEIRAEYRPKILAARKRTEGTDTETA
jgi:hypothetical protein